MARLARLMSEAGLDAVLVTTPANLYYFSGFRTTLYTRFNGLLVSPKGNGVLVTSYVDEQLAKQPIWGSVVVDEIRIHGPLARPDVFQDPLEALGPELGRGGTLGVDGISFALSRELKAAYPQVEIREVSPALDALRRLKEPSEVENVRNACRIALDCMAKATELLAESGLTEVQLAAELEYRARQLGADGYGYPILISSGEKIAAPHSPPLPRPIADDTPFVRIAFAPSFDGYCSSIIRTFRRRPPPPLQRRFADAFFQAMGEIEAMLRPGVNIQDILGTVTGSYERSGVREYWGGDMGYSIGIAVQEPPRIGGRDATVIEAGMVFAVMPGLRKPGEATFHHSDVYAVTEAGCECLSRGLQELVQYG
jgi:Xaa-Pro dipeptidase